MSVCSCGGVFRYQDVLRIGDDAALGVGLGDCPGFSVVVEAEVDESSQVDSGDP